MVEQYVTTFRVMMEILLIVAVGWGVRRLNLINGNAIRVISQCTVGVFLPSLIFRNIVSEYSFFLLDYWWVYPLLGIAVSGFGALVGQGLVRAAGITSGKQYVVSMLAFQNCGYLPLVLAQRLCSPALAAALMTAIFLFIQGFNLVFWTIGVGYLNRGSIKPLDRLVTVMPLVALLAAGLVRLGHAEQAIPVAVLRSSALLGACTIPLALFTLGAAMTRCGEACRRNIRWLWWAGALKMLGMPACGMVLVSCIPLPPVMAALLLIELAMPAAVNLSVVAQANDDEAGILHQGVLRMHIIGIFTIPLFLACLRQ